MLSTDEARAVQEEVARACGDPVGVRDEGALAGVLATPFARRNGIPVHPTFFNQVAALYQAVLTEKPFAGANRRTALVLMLLLLEERGYRLEFAPEELERLATGVEVGFTTAHRITVWIKGHSRRLARPAPRAT